MVAERKEHVWHRIDVPAGLCCIADGKARLFPDSVRGTLSNIGNHDSFGLRASDQSSTLRQTFSISQSISALC
jgi:hypothetical protein